MKQLLYGFSIAVLFFSLYCFSFFKIDLADAAVNPNFQITTPAKIYKNQLFTINYKGAQRNRCYFIDITPKIPQPENSFGTGTDCTQAAAANEYKRLKTSQSGEGTINIGPILDAGNYSLHMYAYDGLEYPTYNFTVEENPNAPKINFSVCAFKTGEDPTTTTTCNTTGSYEDTFAAEGEILNAPAPYTNPIKIFYSRDGGITFDSLTSFAASPQFSYDISEQIRGIQSATETGTIIAYVSFTYNSIVYYSPRITFLISNLSKVTPTTPVEPTTTPYPPLPPACSIWADIKSGEVLLDPKDPKIINGEAKCLVINTALGPFSSDPSSFVTRVFGVILGLAGTIALLLIIYSGYKLLTSQGNPEIIQGAKETLTSAIVGLLFIIFTFVIFQTLTSDILHLPGF